MESTDLDSKIIVVRQPPADHELRRKRFYNIYVAGATVGSVLATGMRHIDIAYDVKTGHIRVEGPQDDPSSCIVSLKPNRGKIPASEPARASRFELVYTKGTTVRAAIAAGLTLGDVKYDVSRGFIYLESDKEFLKDAASDMYYRPNTDHLDMIAESRRVWGKTEPNENDIVLDIGAHVGGYAVWAARRGAQVVAFEPAPDTFKVLEKNAQGLSITLHNAAIVGDDAKSIDLWLTKDHTGRGSCMASLNKKIGRKAIQVPAKNFSKIINEIRPTVLKIDAEEAEYYYPLMDKSLLSSVRVLAIEFHLKTPDKGAGAKKIISSFKDEWELVSGEDVLWKEPLEWGSRWAVNGVWRRKT